MTMTEQMQAEVESFSFLPAPTQGVAAAITNVIRDLPAIGKDSEIKDGPQRYRYRGIEQIKAELKPLLAKHGVVYVPSAIESAVDSEYQIKSGATWQRVRLVVHYRIYGPDGSWIPAVGRGEGADNSDKACNKAMTTAEKQMLVQVFCIADSDGDPDHDRAPAAEPVELFSAAQAKGAVFERVGRDKEVAAEAWAALVPSGHAEAFTPIEVASLVDRAGEWLTGRSEPVDDGAAVEGDVPLGEGF